MEKWYLFIAWGSAGDRYGNVEEYDDEAQADRRIIEVLKEHPDAVWTLVHGVERGRCVSVPG